MAENTKVTPTDDPREILSIMHRCLTAHFEKKDLHQQAGRPLDATNSDHTGCYTDGANDND